MYDPTLSADAVSTWTSLGVKLPAPLTKAINAYKALRYVEIDYQPWFDASEVTANNAEAKVREFADALALTLKGSAGQSPLAEAKRAAVQVSARAVINLAGEAVPAIIEALTPAFEKAVAAFTDAVQSLPEELTSESIVAGGASVLADYESAKDAARFVHRVESWLSSLTELPAYAGLAPAGVLKVLAPETRGEVAKLLNAHQEQVAEPRVEELGGALLHAARTGIAFKIQTPRESAELLEHIESLPVRSTFKLHKP